MKRFNKRKYRKTAIELTVEELLTALTREAELRYYAEGALGKIRLLLNPPIVYAEKQEMK